MDSSLGRVYVADRGNGRVNVFKENGDFLFSFGTPGVGTGQFTQPNAIAVDIDPTSSAFQDVYVVDAPVIGTEAKPRIQRFTSAGTFDLDFGVGVLNSGNDPIAVGSGGDIYVGDNVGNQRTIKWFTSAGILAGSSQLTGEALIASLAVDSSGTAYVTRFGSGEPAVQKYETSEPSATLLNSFDTDLETKVVALDAAGNLYAAQRRDSARFITKRDSSNAIVKRFGAGQIEFNLNGLTAGASGILFGTETYVGSETLGNRVIAIPEPPPGPLPCCQGQDGGNTEAALKGQVNPEGKSTTYHFEYLTEEDFVANGNDFEGPNLPVETPESAPVGSDFELYPAQAAVGCPVVNDPPQPECLEPSTLYHVRLVATNPDGETFEESTFETLDPFDIEATFATKVTEGSTVLGATVNPLGIPATAYFEYVDEASFQASGFDSAVKVPNVPGAQPLDLGAGNTGKTISAAVSSLAPNTAYRYRVRVADSFVPDGDPQGIGPERTFTTFPRSTAPSDTCPNTAFRDALSRSLPDCRAYEMVSPIDKNGGDIRVGVNIGEYPTRLDQSATDGESVTYSAVQAFADPESAPFVSQFLSRRIAGQRWTTRAINPPRESTSLIEGAGRLDIQYKFFSPDLANGWFFQDANPPLDECAPEGFINLYRRDLSSGEYEALLPVVPLNPSQLAGALELQGVSADGTHTVFRANTKLTPGASGANVFQLYEHVADEGCGQLRLVSLLPSGKLPSPAEHASAGVPEGLVGENREGTMVRALSADGSRIFFNFNFSVLGSGSLFLRVNADQEQSPVSAGKCTDPEKACTLRVTNAEAQFWTATVDGSLGVYSVGGDLFEYDAAKGIAGESASTQIAGGFKGVVGASEDASRIYFVSTEEIGGEGTAGQPNLYLYRRNESGVERYRLVATVDPGDVGSFRDFGFGISSRQPIKNGTRLTPDGSHLAFVSTALLTGYDNTDVADGRPAQEIFLYDAESDELRCVSCNPSGGRPQGRLFEFGSLVRRVAAMMAPGETQTFAPRALAEDGQKLFFESFESLLPRDVNETMDVYEWQRAASAAECQEAGAELFAPKSGGCLSLISSGQDEVDSEFADASPDGTDVFIRTASSLVPQDPGQVDVYDVRAGGGLPTPVLPGDPCETPGNPAACPGPVPPGPSEQAPASSTGQSSGNVAPKKPKSCPKGKVPKKGKCVKKGKAHKKKGKAKSKKGAKRAAGKSGGAGR